MAMTYSDPPHSYCLKSDPSSHFPVVGYYCWRHCHKDVFGKTWLTSALVLATVQGNKQP